MQKTKTAITLLLVLTFAVSMALPLATTQAQTPATLKTYSVIDATPNPVGVGEDVLIRFGITQATGSVLWGWEDLTVTVVKPDGTSQTLGPFTTDSTGATYTTMKPTVVGTYKLTSNFPQQPAQDTFFDMERGVVILAGTTFKASTSDTIDLVVTETPSPVYPNQPLPSEYWSRPVDDQLRDWYNATGNWVRRSDNSIALYNNEAPETAHVLWAKDLTTGGIAGGLWGDGQVPAGMFAGDAYAGKFADSVILNGVLYYNRDDAKVGYNGIVAVDLHTGKELWFRNNTVLSFGQILYFNSFNVDGVFAYLWDASAGSTWNAYNPFTGEWVYTMINVPSGTQVYGPSGEILIYQIDFANRWLACWNSTAAGQTAPGFSIEPAAYGSWSAYYAGQLVHGSTINGSDPRCYSWNVTIPAGLTAGSSFFVPILKVYPDRVMSIDFNQTRVRVWAVSIAPGTRGTLIFDKTWTPPAEWLDGFVTLHYGGATDQVQDGVMTLWAKELRRHYGFSVETGAYLWETDSEMWLDAYGWGNVEHTWYFAYGKLFSVGVAGIVYAYDLKTGDTVWEYNMSDIYNEPVTGNFWWGWITNIADGKVYVGTLEHSAEQPVPRGGPFICLDAATGAEVFRVNGMFRATRWGGNAVMGDNIIATMDTYDQRIYAVGKGPTATTASGPGQSVAFGSTVTIEGTVTDISPGTQDDTIKMRFPNGVPAVADESMSAWMLHVYKQFTHGDVTGVPVIFHVIDANGNTRNIGETTTDPSGFYSMNWKPDISGKYTVIASFAGSKAYYPSYAYTAFFVENEVPAEQEPTQPQPSMADLYFVPAVAGIVVMLVVILVLVILLFRRK